MANAIEILYFIQQKSPTYMQNIEMMDSKAGSKESLLSATISASEEVMSILEEVIMYTFQQCVYYITKSLYVVFPALLDYSPFRGETSSEACRRVTGARACACSLCVMPEAVRRALCVFQTTAELMQQYQVHAEIQSQMFAYLFFFTNASLFNLLIDKGPVRGWFHRSQALQIQACLRMLLDWAKGAGRAQIAQRFFAKLCSMVTILITPASQLSQMSWKVLRTEHPCLKPVQLHRILTQYQLTSEVGSVSIWQPSSEDEAYVYRTVDLSESFDNHPPIVLPSAGFKVDLESECVDDSIYRQLLYIRHFLWGLRTKNHGSADRQDIQRGEGEGEVHVASVGGRGEGTGAEERPRERARASHHKNGTGSRHAPDLSCLLTPPNTPLFPEFTHTPYAKHSQKEHILANGCARSTPEHKLINGYISNGTEVDLDKGPYGLGMGLIDGLHTPLNTPGIYIRTLIPDGPAASDGRLHIGDRILAVNGKSLIGADYQSAVDLIRLGGRRLRFLVAKSDPEVSEKISASSC